jgi:nicotianamine synthase
MEMIIAKSELQAFPYYQNYIDLTRLEISAISAIDTRPIKNIAFIGSGPLPLSSLCLIDQLNIFSETKQRSNLGLLGWIQNFLGFGTKQGIRVVNIDHCPAAIEMSTALCNSLGPSAHGIEHSVSDAISSYDLRDFDVIFLAALVGANQAEKEEILRSVTARMREGALVVIRSVNGMRELCYPVFEGGSEGVGEYIEVGVTVHPGGEVVNSVVVGRVKAFGGRK